MKVELETEAAELGEALGWGEGVPGAEVRVHRIATPFQWQTALTDSSGLARFPDLLTGFYRLAAHRVLTDEETDQLGSRRRAFGDGRRIALSGLRTAILRLRADEPGALVISEVYGPYSSVGATECVFHHYLELYNNSDSVIYLDGKILGRAWHIDWEAPEQGFPCQATEPFRNDSEGVWAIFFHQFPGSGVDYPLPPGQPAVVALDAVDHSQFDPSFPNLSAVDFELLGPADVDNPGVPNMPDVGLHAYGTGHGFDMRIRFVFFLSEPVDIEELAHERPPVYVEEWVLFPAAALLDVVATEDDNALQEHDHPPCGVKVHGNFDRLEGGFTKPGEAHEYSVQRLVLGYSPGGRAILQDTNTSAVDLIRAPYTVGTLPEENN